MSTIMITFKANVPIMEVQYFVKEDRIKRVFWHWNLAKIQRYPCHPCQRQ